LRGGATMGLGRIPVKRRGRVWTISDG